MTNFDYDKEELKSALLKVGIRKGGIVFSHIGMGFLGCPKEGASLDSMFEVIYSAFMEILGKKGTWLVPTFSYSFYRGEPFDIQNSVSRVGYFTEIFRKLPGVKRSREPIFSVAGIGPGIGELFKDLPMDSFGKDCIYDRLFKADASICNIGVGFKYATFVHYIEQAQNIPYRFKKTFTGEIINGNKGKMTDIVSYVRTGIDDKSTFPDLTRLEKDARVLGYLKSQTVGRGRVTNIFCRDFYKLCAEKIKGDPWYLAVGKQRND